MKTFWTLVKTSINVSFGISALKYRFTREKRRLWEPLLIGGSVVLGVGCLELFLTLFMIGVFSISRTIQQPELILVMAFLASQVVILFFGIMHIVSSFYFSRDLDILIPMPLKPYQVLGSKFVTVLINECLIALPFMLPAIIIYGIGMGEGLFYWLKALLLIPLTPVIPLVICSLFVVLLMRVVNLRKSKDLLVVIGSFLGLVVALGINFLLQRTGRGTNADFFNTFVNSQSGLIDWVGRTFPPSIWATYGLARGGTEGILYFLLFLLVCVAGFFILMWIADRLFYKALLAGSEVIRKRRVVNVEKEKNKYVRISSPVVAVFRREWRMLFRTPVYLMNGVVGVLVGPIILVMMLFVQDEETGQIIELVRSTDNLAALTLGGTAFILFTAGMNIVASTSLSREGKTFWISKIIPMPAEQQVLGKLLQSFAVTCLGIVVTFVLLAVILALPLINLLLCLVLGVTGSILLLILDLMIDVIKPKLDWINPHEAVKTNINGLLGMLVSMIVMAILGAAAVFMLLAGLADWLVYLAVLGLMLVMLFPSLWGLFALAKTRYANLEM